MKPGSGYAIHMFAIKTGVSAVLLKPVMLEMLAAGKLSTFKRGKNTCFIRAGTEHLRRSRDLAPKPITEPGMVALPRTLSPLVGELTGYFAEISRRVDLAMMARPR
jgi:hypothetical protein